MARLMIKAKGLVDVERMTVAADPWIIVSGGVIEAVGAQSSMPPESPDLETVDLGDRFILPGLINFHAHVCLPGDGTSLVEAAMRPYETTVIRSIRNLRAELFSGVTFLRDCGGHPNLLNALSRAMVEGLVEGPRLYHCAEVVTITGGHGSTFGVEADGPEEVIRAVRKQFKRGAAFVKLMATGGGTPNTFPGLAAFSVAEHKAAVETAHRIEKKVAVHARGIPGMRNAVDAGVDFVEHACFELPDGGQKFDERLAGDMAEAGIYVTPTIRLYRDGVERLMRLREERGLSPEDEAALTLLQRNTAEKLRSLARLRAAGATILAGNDAGIPQTGFGEFWKELAMLTEGGMSPLEAVAAATLEPARALGLDREIGSIRPGKRADIIAASGDPARDISRLGEVSWVMKGGVIFRK